VLDALFISRQLISLRCHNHARNFQVVQPSSQREVKRGGEHPGVHQVQCQRNNRAFTKVSFSQVFPLPAGGFPRLRIAIPGQINQEKRAINPIEVNTLGLSRSRTSSGEAFLPHQPVYQAGFPYVGTTGQGDFRNSFTRKILPGDGAHNKFSANCFHREFIVGALAVKLQWAMFSLGRLPLRLEMASDT
jgi:hypothetical protein